MTGTGFSPAALSLRSGWHGSLDFKRQILLGTDLQVKGELAVVDKTNAEVQSFARANFIDACEAAINEQIK
jgi:hypothetical protein